MNSVSQSSWMKLFVMLLGMSVLMLGQDNSFVPFSFHGLCLRLCLLTCLLLWLYLMKSNSHWGKIWTNPIWWMWVGLTIYQGLLSLEASTPGFSLNFLEGRFWISLLIMMAFDAAMEPGVRQELKKYIGLAFVLGVMYGFYQVWIALPELRSNLEEVGIASDTHKERFMLRLNSDEMFGTRLYSNLFGLFALVGFFVVIPRAGQKWHMLQSSLAGLMLLGLFFSDSKGAFLAGLAVGTWSDQQVLSHLWKEEKTFRSSIDRNTADAKMQEWLRAVERSKAWIQ